MTATSASIRRKDDEMSKRKPTPITETPVDLDASCEETDVKRFRKADWLGLAQRMWDSARHMNVRQP